MTLHLQPFARWQLCWYRYAAVRLGGRHNMPPPVTLTFDLLTLKSVWESHVTWGTPLQSFVFLGVRSCPGVVSLKNGSLITAVIFYYIQ